MRKCDDCYCCDCSDPDMGCTMPSIDRRYAYSAESEQHDRIDTVEEFISKYGKQPDGQTGLQKMIAEFQVQIENRILENIMAELNEEKTN